MLKDPDMMIAGSDAFASVYSTRQQFLNLADPVIFDFNQSVLNVDHILGTPNVVVRRDGVYLCIFAIQTDEPCQFSMFVNATKQDLSTDGTNSGGGELIIKQLLKLRSGDVITVRNFSSGIGTISINPNSGGTLLGTDAELIIRKISAYPCDETDLDEKQELPHRLREKFEKIEHRMLKDKTLQLKGSSCYGSVFTTTTQTVAIDSSILFDQHQNLHNMTHVLGTGDLAVQESGFFVFDILMGLAQAAEFTVFVNGTPNLTTTAGINKGANQLYLRQIIPLNAGDIVSVRNHISNVGSAVIAPNPGGLAVGVDALMLLTKIAQLKNPYPNQVGKEGEEEKEQKHAKKYEAFENFLKRKHHLQATGNAYFMNVCNTQYSVNAGDPVIWEMNPVKRYVKTMSNKPDVKVLRTGVWEILFDGEYNAPSQFTMFTNNVADISTTSGTDSGAGQISMRQLVGLKNCDEIKICNYQSFTNPVTAQLNAGGTEVGSNTTFVGVQIAACEQFGPCERLKK